MSALDVDSFRGRLQEERQHVLEAIENLHHENPGSMSDETEEASFADNHLGDVATITFDREMASTLEENSSHVLAAIDTALERVEDGSFGTCATCGREIGQERLEALPWVAQCIECKRKDERR
jgi:DnaK suppressor protein